MFFLTSNLTNLKSSKTNTSSIVAKLIKKMPYVFVSTQIRLETGPTVVGDEWSDKELMTYLGAELMKSLGNNFFEYRTPDSPRIVLNKLEIKGYKLVSTTGIGQTCVWTMHRQDSTAVNNAIDITNSNIINMGDR